MEKEIMELMELSMSLNEKITGLYNRSKLVISEEELKPLYDAIWHISDAIECQSEILEKASLARISA